MGFLETIKDFFVGTFGNAYLASFFLSMVPIFELKGAIPVCFAMLVSDGANSILALVNSMWVCYLGSTLVGVLMLLLFIPIIKLIKKIKPFRRFAEWIEGKIQKRAEKICAKKGIEMNEEVEEELKKKRQKAMLWSVFTFVAIPLPLTGVWTGSAISAIMGLPFKKSVWAIVLGNLTAGLIITLLTLIGAGAIFGIAF